MKLMTVRRSHIYIAAAAALFAAAAAVFLLTRGYVRFISAGILILAALGFLLFWLVCSVQYCEENKTDFTVRTLGTRRNVVYSDLWGVRKNRLYLPKGSITLAGGKQSARFLEYANRRYQSVHGKRIPKVTTIRRMNDPMNGNAYEPWSYIIIVGLMSVISAAVFVFFLVKNGLSLPVMIFGISTLFCGFMLVMLIYVGRNADILPRRLVEFYFKPGALTFSTEWCQEKKEK